MAMEARALAEAAPGGKIRFRIGGRMVAPQELLTQLVKDPRRVGQAARGGFAVVAQPAVVDWMRSTAAGQWLDDEGEVETSALTGVEEALIIIAVLGTLGGLAVGYLKGYGDGLEDGQAATTDDEGSTEEGGSTEDGGDTGGGGGEGGEGDTGGGGSGAGGGEHRRRNRWGRGRSRPAAA
jgi:hypothetical protein